MSSIESHLSNKPKQVFFNPIHIFDTFTHSITLLYIFNILFSFNVYFLIYSLLTKYLPKSVKRDTRGETSELSSSTSSTSSTSSSSKRKRDNQNDDDDTMKEKELPTNTPNDTHLIPTAPILAGAFRHTMFMARSSVFHHVWVEYALTMLHSAFRRRVLSKKRHTHLLQPFAMILARCLKLSKENKGK
jgi:hypothetical protein